MLQLYLLEIFIEDIHFSKNIKACPKPTDLIITATVNNFISFEIQIAELTDSNDNDKPSNNINFNSGKSCLFPITPQDLITRFENNPLLIVVSTIGKCLAVIKINWDKQFLAMIKNTIKNPRGTQPVIVRDKFVLKDEQTSENIGDITAQIRLICFGEQIQSNYRALTTGKILVKSHPDSIIFQCQAYDESSSKSTVDMLPTTPFYYPNVGNVVPEPASTLAPAAKITQVPPPITITPAPISTPPAPVPPPPITAGAEFSTITLLNNQFQQKLNVFNVESVATFGIVSLVNRPEENKFFNLNFVQDYHSNGISSDSESTIDNNNNKLTSEKINRSLCKNRNCPAAIKFKEYGIGPLANGSGLGTVTNYVKLPAKYGLSNTYGTFDYYGPYGLLSRPDEGHKEKIGESTKPLRLKGGGAINYQTIRNPFVECQDIMRQFDRILQKFRSSLSPCGQASCPYAQDILKDLKDDNLPPIFSGNCNQPTMCYSAEKKLPPIHWDCPEPLPEGVCKNPQCPYLPDDIKELNRCYIDTNRSKRKSQTSCEIGSTGVCGNSTCPYAEPEKSANITCKNSKCPFRYPEITSKIPQDLQKFIICENPSCPYLTKSADDEKLLTEETVDDSKPKKTPYRPSIDSDENPNLQVEYTSTTRIEPNENLCELNKCCAQCADSSTRIVKPKTKRIRKKQRFDYTIGNQYPGVRFGHHQCKPAGSSVPANQGWLWNLYARKGWRPGVIQNTIAQRIRQHWEQKGIPMLRIKQFQRGYVQSDDEIINIEQKPTLQIQKRDGHYYITLHPLKDPRTVALNEDPYMNCTPLQFKITENKKLDNSEPCICTSKSCESTSDSDLDIEFTSPAGLIHPERFKKRPNIVHCDTQYDPKDFDETLKGGKKKKKDKKNKKDKKDKKKKKGK